MATSGTHNAAVVEELRRADKDLVDALDVAAEVVRGLEASAEEDNKEAVERAIASFKEKVSGALRTYVKACNETCAGVSVPNRVTMGQGEGGESMGDEMKVD